MKANQKRERVLSAARGQLRHANIDPKSQPFSSVLLVLDDFSRQQHEAGVWYTNASDNQLKLLAGDWKRWRK